MIVDRLRQTPPRTLLRFAFTGGIVALTQMSVMTVLVALLDFPAQPALIVAYLAALAVHFTMNRNFVFSSDAGYALHLSAQGIRYLALVLCGYSLTALSLAVLPGLLGLPQLAVYFMTVACLSLFSFLILQGWIFHKPGEEAQFEPGEGGAVPAPQRRAAGTSARSSLSSRP